MTPLVSIIVPVYNAEKWLDNCIKSILNQTYDNFELILINDGSIDSSKKICDYYKSIDKRIKVYHTANSGVSNARNLGMEKSEGKWITCIDSDDWVKSDYLKNFNIEISDFDICYQGIQYAYENGNKDVLFSYPDKTFKLDSKNINSIEETRIFFDGCPVAKLYKASIIKSNKLKFNDQICMHEDHVFVFDYLQYVNTVSCKSYIGYNYRRGLTDSLSSRIHKPKDLLTASDLLRAKITLFTENGLLRKDQFYNELLTHYGFSQRLRAIINLYRLNYNYKYRKNFIVAEKHNTESMDFYRHRFRSNSLLRLIFVRSFCFLPFNLFDSMLWLITNHKKS